MQLVLARIGRESAALLGHVGGHLARTLPLEVGVVASYMGGGLPGHGPLKARHAP